MKEVNPMELDSRWDYMETSCFLLPYSLWHAGCYIEIRPGLFLAFPFAVLYSAKGPNSAVTKTSLNVAVRDAHGVEQSHTILL